MGTRGLARIQLQTIQILKAEMEVFAEQIIGGAVKHSIIAAVNLAIHITINISIESQWWPVLEKMEESLAVMNSIYDTTYEKYRCFGHCTVCSVKHRCKETSNLYSDKVLSDALRW